MQQITEETTRVMTDVEVALHKRKQRLDGLLQHGDPFTGRFLCDLRTVACFAKDLVEHNGKVTISTATKEGIHGSRILSYGPDWQPYRFPNNTLFFERWVEEQAEKHRPFYCGGIPLLDNAPCCVR